MLGIDVNRRSRSCTTAVNVVRPATVLAMLAMLAMMVLVALGAKPADAALPPNGPGTVAPTGQGLNITPGDLRFILAQIKIAERHAATLTPAHPCDTLV